jgi:hypothetical protein
MDRLIRVLLIILASVAAFSAGTYVGSQVSKSDRRRVQLEKQMLESVYGP